MFRRNPNCRFAGFSRIMAALSLGGALVPWPAVAQQSSAETAPQTTIKVEVRQVLVPVVVTDKHGHSVTGLKADDFSVTEDGEPEKLTWFGTASDPAERSTVPAAASVAAPAAAAPPPPTPTTQAQVPHRTYLLCLDTLNSSFGSFGQVRNALHKLFKEEPAGSDATYALVALGRQPVVVQNLTQDPAAILAALGSKELTKAIEQSETSNLASQETELSQALSGYCQICPCAGQTSPATRTSGGSGQICDGKRQSLEMWAQSAAREQEALTRDFLRNLGALTGKLADLPGKRLLIFISDGFNLRPGRNLFGMLSAYFQNPSELENHAIDDLEPQIQQILRLATAHDVTFYTLDSRGLYTTGSGFSADDEYRMTRITVLLPEVQQQRQTTALENQDAMAELAQTTGGVFFHNSNDLFRGVHQALADGREYYLLAYASTHNTADGRFRQIAVHVRG
ncbi:MAG TPA: VWA domain-containing protein, partial [Terriglobia bacterium]|nr:VWA domain-containing protein [Terriglobia bacterium]